MGILSELRTALRNKSIVKNIFFVLLIIIFMHLIYGVYRSSQTLQEGKKGSKRRKGKGGKKRKIPKNCTGKDRRYRKRCAKLICSQRESAKSRKKCKKRSKCKRRKGRGYAFLANKCRRCFRTKNGKPKRWTKITINGKKKIRCRRIKFNKVEVRGFAGAVKTAADGAKTTNVKTDQAVASSSQKDQLSDKTATQILNSKPTESPLDSDVNSADEKEAETELESVTTNVDDQTNKLETSNEVQEEDEKAEEQISAASTELDIAKNYRAVFNAIVQSYVQSMHERVTSSWDYMPNSKFNTEIYKQILRTYVSIISTLLIEFNKNKQYLLLPSNQQVNTEAKYIFAIYAIFAKSANRHPKFTGEPFFYIINHGKDSTGNYRFSHFIHKGRKSKDYLLILSKFTYLKTAALFEPIINAILDKN